MIKNIISDIWSRKLYWLIVLGSKQGYIQLMKNQIIHHNFNEISNQLEATINGFSSSGVVLGEPSRNTIKLFELKKITLNVKSFKKPHVINQIIYGYFRKSKAQRSYEYATMLLDKNIGTPRPIAYFENKNILGLLDSYYISEHLDCDLTYRELLTNKNYENHEVILRAFTHFTFDLHEKGVYFLDHSPGNTLIKKNNNDYDFFLVDLNRMKFQNMEFSDRMQNFARLTPIKEMVEVMSDEYAKISGFEYQKVFDAMWGLTEQFQEAFHRKQRLKKKLKFWKK